MGKIVQPCEGLQLWIALVQTIVLKFYINSPGLEANLLESMRKRQTMYFNPELTPGTDLTSSKAWFAIICRKNYSHEIRQIN